MRLARARMKIDRLGLAPQIRANPMRDVIDRQVTNSANWFDVALDQAGQFCERFRGLELSRDSCKRRSAI
jgi:hypothetical protein